MNQQTNPVNSNYIVIRGSNFTIVNRISSNKYRNILLVMFQSSLITRCVAILLFLHIINVAKATEKATVIFAGEMTEIATSDKGGYPELATLLKQQRKSETPTFFFYAGGSLGPSTLSSLDRGTHIIDLLNSLEPDAMGVSKREFTFLEDELSLRSYEAAFPLVASNLIDKFTRKILDGLIESTIVQKGETKIGVLSILDHSVIEEYAISRITISNSRATLEKQSKILREADVDLIVLLYSTPDPMIKQYLQDGLIDFSLRRDEHSPQGGFVNDQHHTNDLLLSDPARVAIINLEWEKNKPESLKLNWSSKSFKLYAKDSYVLEQVIDHTDRLAILLRQPIGLLTTPMSTTLEDVRTKENAFANFITDTLIEYTGADIALINGGTIRGEKLYDENTIIRRSDVIKELPFRNTIVVLEVTGENISLALENGFSLIEKVKGRYPQISGMQVKYDSSRPVGNRVISATIDGQELVLNKKYKLATTDYLSVGGDGYASFRNLKHLKFKNQMSRLVSDIIIDSIKLKNSIAVSVDSRLIDINQ